MSTRATLTCRRTACVAVISTTLGLGCGTGDDTAVVVGTDDERPAVVETRWTDRTELFVEYPARVALVEAADLAWGDPSRPADLGRHGRYPLLELWKRLVVWHIVGW